jgi:hypothetical protein
MIFYAIYHRPTNTFSTKGMFKVYLSSRLFSSFNKNTKLFANIGPAKAFITSALKECKSYPYKEISEVGTQFAIGLEVVEIDIQPQIEKSVYSASFNLEKL